MIHSEIFIASIVIFGIGILYAIYNYINDCMEQNYIRMHERSNKMHNGFNDRFNLLEQKLKDGLQSNAVCCKSAVANLKKEMEKLDYPKFKFDARLLALESKIFSSETQNENGERVISVTVPLLKDVPLSTEPLGSGSDCSYREVDFKPKGKK
jgi:hypothetical protein